MTDDPIVIAWAAGLFDGEGTIGVTNKVTVAIQMTDLDILERMKLHFGGSLYSTKVSKTHHKPCWKWQLGGTLQAKEFLRLIYPLLGVRRQARCDEAFAVETRASRKAEFVSRVVALREQGLTHKAISDIMGVDRSYVSHILRKLKC